MACIPTALIQPLSEVLAVLVEDSLKVLFLLAYLLYLNWKLTLIALIIIPGIALVIRVFSSRLVMTTSVSVDKVWK